MILFLLILIVAFLLQFFLPWWIIGVVCFGLAFWRGGRGWSAFLSGFGGIALGWLALSLFVHIRTEGILSEKVSQLFSLPNAWLLLLITALIGGIVGGVTAWAGYCCRQLVSLRNAV